MQKKHPAASGPPQEPKASEDQTAAAGVFFNYNPSPKFPLTLSIVFLAIASALPAPSRRILINSSELRISSNLRNLFLHTSFRDRRC